MASGIAILGGETGRKKGENKKIFKDWGEGGDESRKFPKNFRKKKKIFFKNS